jgi:dienelactone hydrolase
VLFTGFRPVVLFTAVFFPVAVLAGCFFATVFFVGFGSLPPAEPVSIPYEDTSLPGYLVSPPDASGPLPTLIVNNGSDGPVSSARTLLGAPAVARGFRALLFDGPGQQSMLFAHGVPFRPDWENVVTPVVDFLLARPDVDPRQFALAGISQAGYWGPRALAFEHRIAAAVADPE